MTTSDCFVTLVGLESHTDPANPEPFRQALPPSMHYWAPAVERFGKERGLPVRYPIDNLTPEIVISGPDLRTLLVAAYSEDHPFIRQAAHYFGQAYRYCVYAEDF